MTSFTECYIYIFLALFILKFLETRWQEEMWDSCGNKTDILTHMVAVYEIDHL